MHRASRSPPPKPKVSSINIQDAGRRQALKRKINRDLENLQALDLKNQLLQEGRMAKSVELESPNRQSFLPSIQRTLDRSLSKESIETLPRPAYKEFKFASLPRVSETLDSGVKLSSRASPAMEMFKKKAAKRLYHPTPEPKMHYFSGIQQHIGLKQKAERAKKPVYKVLSNQKWVTRQRHQSPSPHQDSSEAGVSPKEERPKLVKRKYLRKIKVRGQSVLNTFTQEKTSPRAVAKRIYTEAASPINIDSSRDQPQHVIPDPTRYLKSVEKLIQEIDEKNPMNQHPERPDTANSRREEGLYHQGVRDIQVKSPVSIHTLKPVPKPKKKPSNYHQLSKQTEKQLSELLDVKTKNPEPKYKRHEQSEEQYQSEKKISDKGPNVPSIHNMRESQKCGTYSDYESSFITNYLNSPTPLSPEPDLPGHGGKQNKPLPPKVVTHDISIDANFEDLDYDYQNLYDLERYYAELGEEGGSDDYSSLMNPLKPNVHVRHSKMGPLAMDSLPEIKKVKPTVLNFPVQFEQIPLKHQRVVKGLKSTRKLHRKGSPAKQHSLLLKKGLHMVVKQHQTSQQEMQAEARQQFVRRVLESGRYTDDEDLFRDYKNPQSPE